MNKIYTNTFPIINLYKKASKKSEIVTQLIYGDSFTIINKYTKWLKIKIKEDGYKGFIFNKKYKSYFQPTHKVSKLKANIYSLINRKQKIGELPFGSKIRVKSFKSSFLVFDQRMVKAKDVKPLKYKEKNLFKKIKEFTNLKYKWGGKSFKGIDCSALIQICLNFNNQFCPRDAKDQLKFFKKNVTLKNIKKNDIIYWKGHVAVALNNKKLIHAYGPMKKTVIMGIDKTIKRIERTAKLKVKEIKRL